MRQEAPNQSLGVRVGRAVVWNAVQLWGYNVVSLGVFVVLGRLLTPRDFGLAAAAMVVIWFMRIVVDAGFSQLLVQRSEIDRSYVDTAFAVAVVLGVAFTAVTIALAPVLASLFSEPRLTNLIRALSVIFIFVALDSVPSALLKRELRWRALAIRRLGATAVSAGVAVWLAVSGAGAWALVAQQIILEGLTVGLLWLLTRWRPKFHLTRTAFTELLAFGGRYSALRILGYLGANVDNFLIALFLGPVALGYYVIAYRVFTVLNELFVQTVSNVSLPAFSRLQHERSRLNAMFHQVCAAAALVAFPTYTLLAISAGQLIPAVFGWKWHASVPVLELLTLAGVAQAQLAFTSNYVIAIGLIRLELPWTIAVTLAELVGFAATVHFGIVAVAGALAVVLTVAWPVRLLFLRAWGGLSLASYARALTPAVIATGVMSMVALPLHLTAPFSTGATLVVELLVGAAVYIVVIAVLAPEQIRGAWRVVRARD
jgi:O-antigen/teichoic acid export membrane protein